MAIVPKDLKPGLRVRYIGPAMESRESYEANIVPPGSNLVGAPDYPWPGEEGTVIGFDGRDDAPIISWDVVGTMCWGWVLDELEFAIETGETHN